MAFLTPVRRGTAVSSTTNATSWTPTVNFGVTNGLNTAIASGEKVLWVLHIACDGASTLTETGGNGWTKIGQAANGSTVTGALFVKETTTAFAAGAHPAFVLGSTAAEQYSCALNAYKAATGTDIGQLTATNANFNGTNTDPPAITNDSGSARDVTVICSRLGDSNVVATAAPANYNNHLSQAGGGTAGASSNSADRQINIANAGTENPGTFTSATENWVSWTAGIYELVATISAAASIVEADDTAEGTSVLPVKAESSFTEADDTTTAAAVTPDRATAAIVEADDTAVGVFTIATAGTEATAAIVEADDTAAGAAVTPDRATAAIVEADDTATGAAVTPDRATAAIVEADDTVVAAVAVGLHALASLTEADDTAAGAAVTPDRAAAAIVEADDTTTGAFSIGDVPLSAVGAIMEADDTATGAAVTPDRATAAIVEADDTATGAAALPVYAQFTVTDDDDVALGALVIPDYAAAAIVEADDTVAGQIGDPIVWDIPPDNIAVVLGRSRVAGSVANRFRSVVTLPRRNRSIEAI